MAALVLLSGGLDSTVAAAHAVRHGGLSLALTFDYGQRARAREIEASAAIAAHLGASHRVISLPFLGELSRSALNRPEDELPQACAEDLDDPGLAEARARSVWVPNRNGLFIHAAACFAQAQGLDTLVVGFNREEAKTFPDNRPEYLEAMTRTLAFTLDTPVQVISPTRDLDKAGIVRLGLDLDAPLHRVWSCYEAGPGHCFRCESCRRLERALRAEEVWDRLAPLLGAR
jgi:7-cyano-7-deazaguanine synthase